jgi:hypothetical protein
MIDFREKNLRYFFGILEEIKNPEINLGSMKSLSLNPRSGIFLSVF